MASHFLADEKHPGEHHEDGLVSNDVARVRELEEKGQLVTLDQGLSEGAVVAQLSHLSDAEQKKIVRKIDWRVIPLLTFLYLIAFVDRTNIGNAKVAGLTDDLNMHGLQYNTAVTIFFVPYTVFEVPSNIVLKLVRPSRYIAVLLFSWGIVMTLMGLITSYKGLLIARFWLGFAESGFFPAATFLLTIWYKRYEYQRRFAIFYSMASLSGAFSGLLAFAIEKMDGIGGRSGWQWIFILEGLVPCVVSFFIWAILPDQPETARFLTPHEKEFVINRIAIETGTGHGHVTNSDKISWLHIKRGLSEWRIWAMICIFWANSISIYGFAAIAPTAIEGLGYTKANAQLLTIPIYVAAVIQILVIANWSDKTHVRWIFIFCSYALAAMGCIVEICIPHDKRPGLVYGFLFPLVMGLYGIFPPLISWMANNLAPSSKRAVGMALVISIGNMGGICGSNIYLLREAPKYPTGYGTSLGFIGLAMICTLILRFAFGRENARRDRYLAEVGEEGIKAQYSDKELVEMGDRSPFFRYSL